MKITKIISVAIVATILVACGSPEEKANKEPVDSAIKLDKLNEENLLAEVQRREKLLNEDEDGMQNGRARALMDAYVAYATRFSNYENAAEYLFKAGEIAMGINMTAESIKYLDKVYNDYPRYERRPYALFLKAFVLENQSNNLDEAERVYTQFIEEYPTHEMADDAKYSIDNMGKSPEELIREFEIKDSIKKAQEAA
ncbi:MAG: tetratricopeptide repeat protein [Vicingaceae bacterium]